MDLDLERRYVLEKLCDYIEAIEEGVADLHQPEENRILFTVNRRPFEVLVWINEDWDMVCVTTRTHEMHVEKIEDAVKLLQSTLETCWDYCVSVSPVEQRYDLSMALFASGLGFEPFESVLYNLLDCAETLEKNYKNRDNPPAAE